MHTNLYGANGRGLWSPDLRDYARWEYGRNAEAFLLSLKANRRRHGPSLRARVRAWFRLPAVATVSPTVANAGTRR